MNNKFWHVLPSEMGDIPEFKALRMNFKIEYCPENYKEFYRLGKEEH